MPGPGGSLCLCPQRLQAPRTDGAACRGNDAVGAVAVAPVLYFQICPRPLDERALPLLIGGCFLVRLYGIQLLPMLRGFQYLYDALPVPRAQHRIHIAALQQRRACMLGIAARHADKGGRGVLFGPADGLARLAVGFRRHGTGIDDIGIRRAVKRHDGMPRFFQVARHGLAVVLVDLAAQGIKRDVHANPPTLRNGTIRRPAAPATPFRCAKCGGPAKRAPRRAGTAPRFHTRQSRPPAQ